MRALLITLVAAVALLVPAMAGAHDGYDDGVSTVPSAGVDAWQFNIEESPGPLAWPVSSYKGHGTSDAYTINGVIYFQNFNHDHNPSSATCPSLHQHHYTGYRWNKEKRKWVRIWTHDHHVCAPLWPHLFP